MNKRIKSLLLCLVMAFTLVAAAAPALAASAEPAPAAEAAPTDGETGFTPNGPNGDLNPITPTEFTIPFTKTVELGGNAEPGETNFELEIIDEQGNPARLSDNVTYTSSVSTKGAGTFNGSLTISGPGAAAVVTTGFIVREKDDGDSRWNYDDTAYRVAGGTNGDGVYTYQFLKMVSTDNGYTSDNISETLSSMSFTNTYTENITEVEVPFTKTVKLGGDVAPGTQSFELEILGFENEDGEPIYPGVSYEATVETNGAGNYEGRLLISGPESEVSGKIAVEEFYVREKNTGADKWTYDDAVWCVKGDDEGKFTFYPALLNENGGYSCGEEAAEKMVFENTYTENKPAPTATPKPTSPKTGDESALALWLTLLLGGTAAAGVVIGARRKSSK